MRVKVIKMTYISSPFMEITYHVGPSNIKYCKIKTKNYEFNYAIDGIRKGKRFESEQRRDLVLQIIARTMIRHTHVIKLANKLGKLAKKTTEKILLELEKDQLIESEQKGASSNSVKIWMIKRPEREYEKFAKKEAKNIVTDLESYVKSIEKNYEKLNPVMKDYAMANLLDILHSWQPIIEIINHDTRIKKEKKKFDSIVNQAYDILKHHDNRDLIDGRPFLRRLLHLKASDSLMNMNNFLEEIK